MTAKQAVPRVLAVGMSGRIAGELRRDTQGRVTLQYDPSYASDPTATALSVTLPLTQLEHRGARLNAWLENLLPDNPRVLDRWGQRFQVSARSPYALLTHVGADVAGAVQFLRPEQVAELSSGGIEHLTQEQVGERLAGLVEDPGAWTPLHEAGQFSLAGVQAKIALRQIGGGWGEPWGEEPTSHILKPPIPGYAHQGVNEHLCLRIARRIGLPAAQSRVMTFAGQSALVIKRYDRATSPDGRFVRIHQEDLCQALGLPPAKKYQSDGGPGPSQVVDLLRSTLGPGQADPSVIRFVLAQALFWVLGATDGHAKNFGLLHVGRESELTPLYDVSSVLPYLISERRGVPSGQTSLHTARLAMTIGDRARLLEIDGQAWRRLADACRLDPDDVVELVATVAQATGAAASEVVDEELSSGDLSKDQADFARNLARLVVRQAAFCKSSILGRTPGTRR